MDFASNYILNYNVSDDECVSDDELEHGMTLSDDSDDDHEYYDPIFSNAPSTVATDCSPSSSTSVPIYDNVEEDAALGLVGPPPPPPPQQSLRARFFKKAMSVGSSSKSSASKVAEHKESDHKKMRKMTRKKSHWRSAPNRDAVREVEGVGGKKWRRADTNIVSLKFGTLIKPSQMHTGDPVYCKECGGLLSHVSHIETDRSDQVWCCEYCDERNIVDVIPEEKPQQGDVTFMLEPALTTTAAGRSGTDQSLIIFCVDVSGSMCVTTEVPGKLKLRGTNALHRMQSFNEGHEDQHLPGERRNLTYVSRLQAMQAAVDFQIGEMAKEHPNRRVALISFNNEVNVIGDGSETEITIAGDKLTQKETLFQLASELNLPQAVKASRQILGEKVFSLEEGGSTALGPALVISVAMAAQCPGSKVIVCTDGMANVGLGNLDNVVNEQQLEDSENFYTYVAETAKEKGVSVSVISIKGTDCKLVELGKIADITEGQVNIVDPLKLTEEFGNIIANPVIATNVKATLVLHKGLYVRYEETNESCVSKEIGNVTADREITFEFGVRTAAESKPQQPLDEIAEKDETQDEGASANASNPVDTLKELPFQIQISYTDMEGNKALRLITKTRPITKDRQLAEQEINIALIGTHTAQLASKFAVEGSYSKSRLTAFMNQRMVSRYSRNNRETRPEYDIYVRNIQPLERQIGNQQSTELQLHGQTHSDSEGDNEMADDSNDEPQASGTVETDGAPKAKKKGILAKMKKSRSRKSECSDQMANLNYAMRKFNSSNFKK
ncbi:circularly permutated Ras protein 1-like [Lineus longissimus]|uniref:circularly permutated Ras protein 1-like n=1 Tax=Lineus longissimus TaxID=88925 RepID=UPI002B4D3ECF